VAQMKLRLLFVTSAVALAAIGASGCGTQAQHGTQAARRASTAPSYSTQEKSNFGGTNVSSTGRTICSAGHTLIAWWVRRSSFWTPKMWT
jgi:hypothetical protein